MDQFVDCEGNWKLKSIDEPLRESTRKNITHTAEISNNVHMELPLLEGVKPVGKSNIDTLIKNIWSPTMTITGIEGLGNASAGNII